MAQCPKCKRNWLWDWEQDIFRLKNGTECKETIRKTETDPRAEDDIECHCFCGKLLGVLGGEGIKQDPLAWKGIDWEAPSNYYEQPTPKTRGANP